MKEKRFLGLGLSIIMMFSSLNVSFGESSVEAEDDVGEESVVEDIAVSGQAVDEKRISLYAASSTDTKYEVEGGYIYFDESTGTITDCDESVTSAVIPSEINGVKVTSIGEYAFSDCSNLTSITIPEGVTHIGYEAFQNCSSLTKLIMPESVTDIDGNVKGSSYAFENCDGLKTAGPIGSGCNYEFGWKEKIPEFAFAGSDIISADLSEGITSIGDYAFMDCDRLKSVTIPTGVSNIGSGAFMGCRNLINIEIPKGITTLDYGVFSGSGLRKVIIPEGVTSIESSAFNSCIDLNSVIIPDSVTNIGYEVFKIYESNVVIYCNSGSYAETYAKENNIPYSEIVKYESEGGNIYLDEETGAICGCDGSVISAHIPSEINGVSVTSIKLGAFDGCNNLVSITIPGSITSIEGRNIGGSYFNVCDNLTSITIEDGLINIGDYAFDGCKSIINIELPESVRSIGEYAFDGCSSLTSITIPESVTSIGHEAFGGCTSLISIILPKHLTDMGEWIFGNCSSLKSVTLPENIEYISNSTFGGCSNLTNIIIPNSVTAIGAGAFWNCKSLTKITIPESVTFIGYGAFSECSNLRSITIPNSVTSIAELAFDKIPSDAVVHCYKGSTADNASLYPTGVTISYIGEGDDKGKYEAEGGYIYFDESTGTITGCDEDVTSVDIPKSINGVDVTGIGEAAFWYCSDLRSISMPDTITYIGDSAFYGCSSLRSITIPGGAVIIDDFTFSGCSSLENVIIGEGITSIERFAFENCGNIKSMTIPESVRNINVNAFRGTGIDTVYCSKGSAADDTSLYPARTDIVYVGEESVKGDLDGDGGITSTDATYALLHAAGLRQLTGDVLSLADVDSDGEVTSTDATYILLKAAGLREL